MKYNIKKICIISSIALAVLGIVIFCVGASLGTDSSTFMGVMWTGLILFLLAILDILIYVYYKAYLKGKEKRKNKSIKIKITDDDDIKRG